MRATTDASPDHTSHLTFTALFKDSNVPQDLLEWHYRDPKSAIARHGFRPGHYGRMDPDEWFQTTVTNVEPTAKQCRVLNPYVSAL